jgi:HAD superfamily hydrolase (TIGR01459 family)
MNCVHKIYASINQISAPYKGVLLDAYGVFWAGNACGLLKDAKEAMKALVNEGKIVGILSNATQLSQKEVEKVKNKGLIQGESFHFYITSGDVVRSIFLNKQLPFHTPRNSYYLFSGKHPKYNSHLSIFEGSDYKEVYNCEDADFIYVAVPHMGGVDQENPGVFFTEIEALASKKLPMVCPNPDLFAHEGNPPRAKVRQGYIAKLYEELGGSVFYVGKPYENIFKESLNAFKSFGINDPKDILMVGDTLETDIRGANALKIKSALTVASGIMLDRVLKEGLQNILATLPSSDIPTYLIERFVYDI